MRYFFFSLRLDFSTGDGFQMPEYWDLNIVNEKVINIELPPEKNPPKSCLIDPSN